MKTKKNKWNAFRSFIQFINEYYDLTIVLPRYSVNWKPLHKRADSNKDVVMTREEVKKILNYNFYNNYHYYVLLRLLAETGMRMGEFLSINIENVNVEKRFVDTQGKTGRKIYYYSKGLAKHLTIYLKERELRECKSNALFLSSLRQRYARRSINNYIQWCVKKLRINKRISSHTFRKTLNTLRKKAGCSSENRRILLNQAVSDVNYACYVKLNYEDYIRLFDEWNPYKSVLETNSRDVSF